MPESDARELLERVRDGRTTPEDALAWFARLGTQDLGFARLDHHRAMRCGFPEVVYGAGKTAAQIRAIVAAFAERGENVLVTRIAPAAAAELQTAFPACEYDPEGATVVLECTARETRPGRVGVLTAGTSDHPVAREALTTLRFFGYDPMWLPDCGVAGLHRLLSQEETLRALQVVIVIAGMEGALPSVVGGLVSAPVIAVPTSIGYGIGSGGFAALAGMLTSCASGVTVANIDNGFGAACAASRILRQLAPCAAPPSAQ